RSEARRDAEGGPRRRRRLRRRRAADPRCRRSPRGRARHRGRALSRIVYGANPVRELLRARAASVQVVYLAAGDTGPALREIARTCKDRQVGFEERDRAELDALAGLEARHQGVIAIAGELEYADLDQLLDDLEGRTPLLVVLDGVQDPRNL